LLVNGERDLVDKVLELVLLGLCIWFLIFELIKVLLNLKNFTFWNLINIVPMVLILINVLWLEFYLIKDKNDDVKRYLSETLENETG